jgi:hypothetical protein
MSDAPSQVSGQVNGTHIQYINLLLDLGLGGFAGSMRAVGLTLFVEVTTAASLVFSVSVCLQGPFTGLLGGRTPHAMEISGDNQTR